MIKSNTVPVGWATYKLESNTPKKFSHSCEDSEDHVRVSSLGIQQRDREFPGNLTLKASVICLQDFHSSGGTRLHLGGHKETLVCTKTQGKAAVIPQETEQGLPASVGGSPGVAVVNSASA